MTEKLLDIYGGSADGGRDGDFWEMPGEIVSKHKPRDVADDCIGREHTIELTEDNDQAQLLHIHRMKIS